MHLEVLSRLSMLLMDDEFRTNLLDAADVTEFLAHIDEAERKKFPEEYGEEKQTQDQPEEGYRVLAVTACPTGIAHTYMAAESLENKANDVPDSGRIYRHGACGQTGIDARNRRRSSGKKRYDNGCRGGNPVCSFRSAAVSGCRCGRFCRGNAWNRSAEKTACSKVRKCAKKSEQKLRKVINKAQYIRTSYLSVEK